MNVSLTPRLEEIIRNKVASGLYGNASEVVREALRLMDDRDRLSQLRSAIAIGDEQIARGEVFPWTSSSMSEIVAEAKEEDRLGLPIGEDVQP